jgi:hypothetical protein
VTVTLAPVLNAAAPSSLYSVAARPAPPASAAVSVTVTGPSRQPAGASSVVDGSCVSIRTVVCFSSSTCPRRSVERYRIVCTPSFEWSAGAGTTTAVPALQSDAPSSLNSVAATPDPASAGLSVTVTAFLLQPAGASSVVDGADVSIRTVAVRSSSMLPATSLERYAIVCTPSFE